jgi:hypothetical protein
MESPVKYLYYSSFLIGASSLVSLHQKDYSTFFFMFILFLSSINYWRNPTKGISRNVDLFLVRIINVYFYGMTIVYCNEFQHTIFVNTLYGASSMFLIEHIYHYYNHPHWVVFHMIIHLYLSFFTPFVLYML